MADAAGRTLLRVKDQLGQEVRFQIKKSTPLRKLMDAYCGRLGLQASRVRFVADGVRIAPDDTDELCEGHLILATTEPPTHSPPLAPTVGRTSYADLQRQVDEGHIELDRIRAEDGARAREKRAERRCRRNEEDEALQWIRRERSSCWVTVSKAAPATPAIGRAPRNG